VTKKDDSEDWVEVAETGQHELATMIAGLLQSEGIPAEVEGGTANPWPETIGAFGNSRVTVPPERAGEARELIKSREKDLSGSRETGPIGRTGGDPAKK
jgi:Putative prokaryotic signal transducing protein